MSQRTIANRGSIICFLLLQFIPIVMFPLQSFSPNSQEWWLPVLLLIGIVIGDMQLILRKSVLVWPWHLLSFAHGFNIISRLMMLWPHATRIVDGNTTINAPYVILSVAAMGFSVCYLWYMELPEVRIGLIR
jgi:hypothetical protein